MRVDIAARCVRCPRSEPQNSHARLPGAIPRLIALERNRYSVPASFANRPVSVRVSGEDGGKFVIGWS